MKRPRQNAFRMHFVHVPRIGDIKPSGKGDFVRAPFIAILGQVVRLERLECVCNLFPERTNGERRNLLTRYATKRHETPPLTTLRFEGMQFNTANHCTLSRECLEVQDTCNPSNRPAPPLRK